MSHSTPSCSDATADEGYTFVEVVIAITLIAVIVIPTLTAMMFTVSESARSRSAAQVETAVVNASDRVNRAEKSCDYLEYVQAAVRSQGWNGDRARVTEEHYRAPANYNPDDTANPWIAGACEVQSATAQLVQRITITITSPDNKVSRTIQVVKSDV